MEWRFYDEKSFEDEMSKLERGDRAKLRVLMEFYTSIGAARPVYIEPYRGGLLCLRHSSGAYKGRRLFFAEQGGDPVALLAYRKESAKADPKAIERARNRMAEHEKKHE